MTRKPVKDSGPTVPTEKGKETGQSDTHQQNTRLLQALEVIIRDLPEEKAREVLELRAQSIFSGPLPPPELLRKYNDILPDAAERIFALTEKEQDHRHNWENVALQGELKYGRLGLWLGAVALIAVIVGVVVCAYLGQSIVAGGLSLLGLAGIVTAFVQGRRFSHDNSEDQDNKSKSD